MIRRTYQMEGEPTGSAQGTPPAQDPLAELQARFAELETRYGQSSTEAKRLKTERDFFEQQTRQPVQPTTDPYQRLNEFGVPVDAIQEVMRREIQQQFAPISRGLQARGQVLAEYPDYNKFESDVATFVNSDPDRQQRYNNMFNADPAGAMEWAFNKFGEAERRKAPAPPNNGNAEQKSEARIPSGRSGESRNKGDESGDLAARAYAEYRKTGDPRARDTYIKSRLGGVLSKSFLDGTNV